MAMTFGSYVAPSLARPFAVVAVLALTAVSYFGVQRTALATRVLVVAVLIALSVVVGAIWLGGAADPDRRWPLRDVTPYSVMQSAGFLFFAFAGYARLATIGEEVKAPERTIPRAIPIALGMALFVYVIVAGSALAGVGAPALAGSTAPLRTAVEAGELAQLGPAARIGAAIASLGALLSLLVGISRTGFAMASKGDFPRWLAAVHPRYRVPHRAELAVGAAVALLAGLVDLRSAIGFRSFAVLIYYAIANAAAWTLAKEQRRWPRAIAGLGLLGCGALALTLPITSVAIGAGILGAGALLYLLRRRAG
jgi:APA family basic amino acid/polyamine antiporter